ncbi:hypothetical protein AOLI_G00159020 [Acnodon oligacanthus]
MEFKHLRVNHSRISHISRVLWSSTDSTQRTKLQAMLRLVPTYPPALHNPDPTASLGHNLTSDFGQG